MYKLLILILFCSIGSLGNCQKFLQFNLDMKGKTHKIFIGETITFRTHSSNEWNEATITDMDALKQALRFDEIWMPISKIKTIRVSHHKNKRNARMFGTLFLNFGVGWAGASVIAWALAGGTFAASSVIIPVIAVGVGVGMLFAKFLWIKKYVMYPERFLRVVDLEMAPPVVEPEPRAFVPIEKIEWSFC